MRQKSWTHAVYYTHKKVHPRGGAGWEFIIVKYFTCLTVEETKEKAEKLGGVQDTAVAEQDERLHQLDPDGGVLRKAQAKGGGGRRGDGNGEDGNLKHATMNRKPAFFSA